MWNIPVKRRYFDNKVNFCNTLCDGHQLGGLFNGVYVKTWRSECMFNGVYVPPQEVSWKVKEEPFASHKCSKHHVEGEERMPIYRPTIMPQLIPPITRNLFPIHFATDSILLVFFFAPNLPPPSSHPSPISLSPPFCTHCISRYKRTMAHRPKDKDGSWHVAFFMTQQLYRDRLIW